MKVTHIENDDSIGRFEVNTEASRAGGKQKREIRRPRCVEVRDGFLPRFRRDHAVKSLVLVATQRHVVAEDVEHADHLAEDEDAVAVLVQALQELVEEDHLAAVHDQTLELLLDARVAILGAIKEVRVVRRLLEFHG